MEQQAIPDNSSGTVEWMQIAVLDGFSAELDQKVLPGGVTLRRLTNTDYSFLYNRDFDSIFNQWWHFALSEDRFCLSTDWLIPATEKLDQLIRRNQFEDVVTCLRLLQPGTVKIVALACWPTNQPIPKQNDPIDESIGELLLPYGPPLDGPAYYLTEKSVEELADLIPKLEHALGHVRIRSALTFFNESYEYFRMRSALMGFEGIDWPREIAAKHDKLIRLWMCLEALLMDELESDEIGKRVSYRAGLLLGKHAAETLAKSWKVRCAVVHGEAHLKLSMRLSGLLRWKPGACCSA
ncbi:MAG TPA: hypothetical protein VNL15_01335 [Dehalococcoidia bacterium]|nr:hypothetical protein [Dehalococcoidia bacterium]